MTFEESLEVMRSIIACASAIRRRYLNEECEECGASYHPRMGPPPKEKKGWCGHACMREMWQEWDTEADDWFPDAF